MGEAGPRAEVPRPRSGGRRTSTTLTRSLRCSPARSYAPARLTGKAEAAGSYLVTWRARRARHRRFPRVGCFLRNSKRASAAFRLRRRAGRSPSARPSDLRVNSYLKVQSGPRRAPAALAHLKPEPTPFSPVGLRIAMRPDGRAPPRSPRRTRHTSRASSSCRTRARSLPRSWRKRSPACRSSTLCTAGAGGEDAGACRRDGEPGARSTPPTPTRGTALRRSSPGSPDPARAMSRCGRRGSSGRPCSADLEDAAIWC